MNFVSEDSIHDLISSSLSFKSLNGWFDNFFKHGNYTEKPMELSLLKKSIEISLLDTNANG